MRVVVRAGVATSGIATTLRTGRAQRRLLEMLVAGVVLGLSAGLEPGPLLALVLAPDVVITTGCPAVVSCSKR